MVHLSASSLVLCATWNARFIFASFNADYLEMIRALTWILLACLAGSFHASAQSTHSKQIYLWDVTYSMVQNGIWEQVRNQLIESIEDIQDLDTEVIVIPFQDDVFAERRVQLYEESEFKDLLNWIREFDVPMPQGGHGTNLCRALERAEDFIEPGQIDVVFLMTDGTHEPKNPASMVTRYPASCVQAYLETHWCPFAMENNAYLVYYQLLGEGHPNIREYTSASCRAQYIKPGSITPDRLFYITPQIQRIVADRTFLDRRTIEIPLTSSLPMEVFQSCQIDAELLVGGNQMNLETKLQGTNLILSMSQENANQLDRRCPETSGNVPYELTIQMNLDPVEGHMVVLTNDEMPFLFHHYEQRWFEIKSNPQ